MTNIVNFIRETNINSFCAFGSAVDAQMSSIEIAKLIGVRHDNLKTSIERLVESGVIRTPAMKVFEEINNLGFNVPREVYVFEGEKVNAILILLLHRTILFSWHPLWIAGLN